MSVKGSADDYLKRQILIDDLVSGRPTHQQLGAGITLRSCDAGARKGVALHIANMALQSGQLERALERRFEQALAFDGYYIYLDKQSALVIWHALPTQRQALDNIISRMMALANLNALDLSATL
ncbi:transcriptional regulator [Pseudomonas orientalis]|uniref:Transcriptional regulator n=1 Tax=Pseudomonas orientalis TaxID=76758 RepID=A0A2L0RRN3_9PSED|nr:transcriptional regulator [Pseudomonas orientalis]AUZ44659.1 transcriptional regulator [Pseudomonas orientalis]